LGPLLFGPLLFGPLLFGPLLLGALLLVTTPHVGPSHKKSAEYSALFLWSPLDG